MNLKHLIIATLLGIGNSAMAQQSWTADNGNGTFTNPLFYDEFSDPDILRVGDDYYLAGTTMHTVPGVNILHSKDLVNWEQISFASTASTSTTLPSRLLAAKRFMVKVYGLLASDIIKVNSMYLLMSTAKDFKHILLTTSVVHGNM